MTASPTPANPDPILQGLIKAAKEDLAQQLNIQVAQISLAEAQSVVWPDSSLGCPQPGMLYTQVLTDGYLFILEASGKTYEYHTNRDKYVIYCEHPSPPVPGMSADR